MPNITVGEHQAEDTLAQTPHTDCQHGGELLLHFLSAKGGSTNYFVMAAMSFSQDCTSRKRKLSCLATLNIHVV